MKKFLQAILLAAVVSLLTVFAVNAWDPGIKPFATCSGVKVSVLPKPVAGESLGQNRERWVVYSTAGEGFFFWKGQSHMNGVVIATWKRQTSNTFGMAWDDTTDPIVNPAPDGMFHWSADRPAGCKPLPKYYSRPKIGDPPNLSKIWPRFFDK